MDYLYRITRKIRIASAETPLLAKKKRNYASVILQLGASAGLKFFQQAAIKFNFQLCSQLL